MICGALYFMIFYWAPLFLVRFSLEPNRRFLAKHTSDTLQYENFEPECMALYTNAPYSLERLTNRLPGLIA